jgi:hypothetical protein
MTTAPPELRCGAAARLGSAGVVVPQHLPPFPVRAPAERRVHPIRRHRQPDEQQVMLPAQIADSRWMARAVPRPTMRLVEAESGQG